MLKIGEFSKLSLLTVKALRFYEKERILLPAHVDKYTGYRYYDASQLAVAAQIKAMRQLQFSVEEIRQSINGGSFRDLLNMKQSELSNELADIEHRLSVIKYLLEVERMDYHVVLKTIAPCTVYSESRVLESYSDLGKLVLESAEECLRDCLCAGHGA